MDNGSSGRLVNHEEGRGRGNRITPPLPRRQQRRRRRAQQHAAAIQTNDETIQQHAAAIQTKLRRDLPFPLILD